MKIFISPAKGFKETNIRYVSIPIYEDKTKILLERLKKLRVDEIKKIMKINDKIAYLNYERYKNFDDLESYPAILTYDGIQYKAIDSENLSKENLEFLQKNLRIISGLYGILKPLDGIKPYRLEMQTKLDIENHKNLYEFWGQDIYNDMKDEDVIINLASLEYSKTITKYIDTQIYVECIFKVLKDGKLSVQSTASKKARGMMVRFIAENKINDYRRLKEFNMDSYKFNEELSKDDTNMKKYVFIK